MRIGALLFIIFIAFHGITFAQEQSKTATTKDSNTAEKTKKQATKKAQKNTETSSKKLDISFPVKLSKQFKDDITHFIAAKKINTMLAGSEDFITLINEETTGNAKGVAILIPNWRQSAASSPTINNLAASLPNKGWTTMVMQSPEKPNKYPSTLLDKQKQQEENQELLKNYQEKLAKRVTKVIQKAANYPGLFMVIAERNNAALLPIIYNQNLAKQPDVLILLSAAMLDQQTNENYVKALANIEVPILDLHLTNDNINAQYIAPLALAQSKKQLKIYYRQQEIDNITPTVYPNKELLSKINGWLKHIGW